MSFPQLSHLNLSQSINSLPFPSIQTQHFQFHFPFLSFNWIQTFLQSLNKKHQMEKITLVLAIVSILSVVPSYGQTSSPCNASMIISLAPCMNFITNSTSNGTSPTTACCDALKSVTSTNLDCACLLVTGNIPFQLPINRTLALSLPRACNTAGVPLQCKGKKT